MANKRGRGISESSWYVARRCLDVVIRLQQGPATKAELLTAVYQTDDAAQDWQKLSLRFENDKIRLRDKLGIPIRYDKTVGGYVLGEGKRPLLNLPDADMQTLAFLADTFQPSSPHAPQVQHLIDTLLNWLPPERQHVYQKAAGQLPDIDLRLRDSDEIAPDVWTAVLAAHNAKQQLSFDYLSSRHADGLPRQHIVEPWYFYFSDRGHYRLRAYCLFNGGPNGRWHPNDYINYRVSRIVPGSARVLPTKLPPMPRAVRPYTVIYELSPEIARFGVSHRPELIGEPVVMEMDEGWVRVEGKTHDIFQLARNLLYYGTNCHVLGGRELVREMRGLVTGLAGVYQ
ncbi:MAG: WYL domain-containing protein [Chloroflexi bacterium]|nr:WYL domain-containing protein [Chloroflexota bacterium]